MRVVEDDTNTEDAVPYWKIDDFLGFPGFSWVWVVLRAARAKKVETKRFYLQKSVPIQPKTSNILPKFCQPTLSDVSASERGILSREPLERADHGPRPGSRAHDDAVLIAVHLTVCVNAFVASSLPLIFLPARVMKT